MPCKGVYSLYQCLKAQANAFLSDDVLGFLLNIDENKVIFYLNGKGLERYFPAQDRFVVFVDERD